MLRAGSVILFAFNGYHLLWNLSMLVIVMCFGEIAPHLSIAMSVEEIANLSPAVFTVTKYLAILIYTLYTAYLLVIQIIIWIGLRKGRQWAFWTVAIAWAFVTIIVLVADTAIGRVDSRWVNGGIGFNIIFLCGIAISGYGLWRQRNNELDNKVSPKAS